jgi:outer membrane immunogenic protein
MGVPMRKIRTQLLATAALVALSSAAYAADMGMPLKAPPPLPPPVQDWSGVYVGLEGGYEWATQNLSPAYDPFYSVGKYWGVTVPTVSSVSQSGWLFGGFAGVQKQWGSWVLGLEGDFDADDSDGSTTSTVVHNFCVRCADDKPVDYTSTRSAEIEAKIDELGSMRGKVGWAFSPNWLIYGTGGLAFAHVQDTATATDSLGYTGSPPFFTHTANWSGGESMLGWAAGAGIDWKWQIDPGSAVILGVEYLHYQFDTNSITLPDSFGNGGAIGLNTKETVDTIKGRISWLFSIH